MNVYDHFRNISSLTVLEKRFLDIFYSFPVIVREDLTHFYGTTGLILFYSKNQFPSGIFTVKIPTILINRFGLVVNFSGSHHNYTLKMLCFETHNLDRKNLE